jgi:hypothetical protein
LLIATEPATVWIFELRHGQLLQGGIMRPAKPPQLTVAPCLQVPEGASVEEKRAIAALNEYVTTSITPQTPNPQPDDDADRFMTEVEVPTKRTRLHCRDLTSQFRLS